MTKTPAGTCPHCFSDDLAPKATRCSHCGQRIRSTLNRVVLATFVILAALLGNAQ